MKLSEKILLLRKRRGLSQEQLAKEINVSRQAIYKWETGITTPDIDNVKLLSEFFNISFNELVDDNVSIKEMPISISNDNKNEEKTEVDDTDTAILQNGVITKQKNKSVLWFLIIGLSAVIIGLSVLLLTTLTTHTHNFGRFEVEVSPSCTVAGVERRYCSCGESESRSIATIPHSEVTIEGYNSTCLRVGITDGKKCSICNTVLKEQTIIPVNYENHVQEIIKGSAANCLKEGLTDGIKCTECNTVLKKQEIIPIGAHTEEVIKGYNATCIRDGLTDGKKCSVCNEVLLEREVILSNGQHVEETIKGYPSTCIKNGLSDEVVCIECGDVLVEATSLSLGSCSGEEILGRESTCTSIGLTKGSICSVCEKVLVKQDIMQTKSHDYVDGSCTICHNLQENYNGFLYKLNSDKISYTIYIDKDINLETLIIPSTNQGYPVTCVGNFTSLTNVGKIILPSTINEIKDNAFYNVASIYSVNFPKSLTAIGENALYGTSIKNLTITKELTSIDVNALSSSKLRYIIFEEGVTKIDASLFSDISTIRSIYIPKTAVEISGAVCGGSENATIYRHIDADSSKWSSNWDYCKDNIKCQIIGVSSCPESLTTFTFILNSDKKSYTVSGNESIMDEEIFIIPSSYNGRPVTHIDAGAFYDTDTSYPKSRYKVREAYIPDSIIVIGRYAFSKCESLTYVKFGNGVKEIHNRAFMQADLKEINLPKSINFIDNCAFMYCSFVSKITVKNGCSAYKVVDGVLYSNDENLLVLYPNADERTSYNIPEGVTVIHGAAFCDSKNLTKVTFPSTLTVIGELSFQNCASLEGVDFPKSLTTIKEWAFSGCTFNTVFIPSSVTDIVGDYVFNFATQSNNIYYEGNIAPSDWKFVNRWMVRFTPNVKEYGTTENGLNYVITNDDELIITSGESSDGKVPSTIKGYEVGIIGKNAFWTNKTFTTVNLPTTIKRIEDGAFLGTDIEYIVLPNGVEYIGNNVFDRCNYLRYVYIPETVTTITGPLFANNTSAIRLYYQKDADTTHWDENWNKYLMSGNNTYYSHNTFKVESPDDIQWVW